MSYPITIKTHWFPGELRMFVDLGQPPGTHREMRQHILLEMRANGDTCNSHRRPRRRILTPAAF